MAPDIAASPIASAGSPTATEADLREVEGAAIAEDKRRRNTAASGESPKVFSSRQQEMTNNFQLDFASRRNNEP